MRTSDALWEVFKATGHFGAYLLYKDYTDWEQSGQEQSSDACCGYLES